MQDKILEIISKVTKKELATVKENITVPGLWDSFSNIELILALEEEFGIMFEEDEVAEMVSAQLIIEKAISKVEG